MRTLMMQNGPCDAHFIFVGWLLVVSDCMEMQAVTMSLILWRHC